MIITEATLNVAIRIPFTDANLTTGVPSFSLMVLKDGVLYTSFGVAPSLTEVGNGMYAYTFIFNATGQFTVFIQDSIKAFVTTLAQPSYSVLTDLKDVARGSWTLDKSTGVLTLHRVNGSVMDTYNFVDNNDTTSREFVT